MKVDKFFSFGVAGGSKIYSQNWRGGGGHGQTFSKLKGGREGITVSSTKRVWIWDASVAAMFSVDCSLMKCHGNTYGENELISWEFPCQSKAKAGSHARAWSTTQIKFKKVQSCSWYFYCNACRQVKSLFTCWYNFKMTTVCASVTPFADVHIDIPKNYWPTVGHPQWARSWRARG